MPIDSLVVIAATIISETVSCRGRVVRCGGSCDHFEQLFLFTDVDLQVPCNP